MTRSTRAPRRRPPTCRWVVTPATTDHIDTPERRPRQRPHGAHPTTPANDDPGNDHTGDDDPGQPTTPGSRRAPTPAPDDTPPRVVRLPGHRPRRWSGWRRRRGRWGRCGGRGCPRRHGRGRARGRRSQRHDAGGRRWRHPRRALGQWRARHRIDLAHGCRLGPGPWHGCRGPSGRRGSGRCRGPSRCRWHGRPQRGRPQRQPQRGQPRVAGPGGRARCGAGAGAGAGRGGKDKKRQGEERDLFDDGADWIDDEDAAPGLLD